MLENHFMEKAKIMDMNAQSKRELIIWITLNFFLIILFAFNQVLMMGDGVEGKIIDLMKICSLQHFLD